METKTINKKEFNLTELDAFQSADRQIIHRDYMAHIHRWTHVVKRVKRGTRLLDFGAGAKNGQLEALYRNRKKLNKYLGLDLRKTHKEELFERIPWAEHKVENLVDMENFYGNDWDYITSFEVIEHVNKKNVHKYLQNMAKHANPNTIIFLSTPNYDPKVGAADNHTYDGQVQEWDYYELNDIMSQYFDIVEVYGTFASQRDYLPTLSDCEREIYDRLHKYYDSSTLANLMAPILDPALARNAMRVMKLKSSKPII